MNNDRGTSTQQAQVGAHVVLRNLLGNLKGASGADFFRRLAEQLALAFGAQYAAIAESHPDGEHLRVLGDWHPTLSGLGSEFTHVDSASGAVLAGDTVYVAEGLRSAYPRDQRLARIGAESYLGVPIIDGSGDVLGLIEIASVDRMREAEPATTILLTMAERAVVEIEREQAEAALRDSEMRYRALIDDSFYLVAEIVEERLIYVSTGYTETLGYAPEDILGGSFYDLIHPDDRRAVAAELQAMAVERRAAHFTIRMECLDHRCRWVECTARAFRASNGEFRTTLFSRDITERLAAEDELRSSEARFRALIQNLQAGVLLLDRDGTVLVANDAASALLGLQNDEMVGGSPYDGAWSYVNEDDEPFPENERPVRLAIATKEAVRDVVLGVDLPSGVGRKWLLVNAQPQFGPDGEVHQVICSFSDITARLAAERELRDSESRFRLLAEHSTDLIGRYGTDGMCLWISPSARAITGYEPEELVGVSPVPFFHPDDVASVRQAMHTMVEEKTNTQATFRFRHKDGHYIWLEAQGQVICDAEGRVVELQSATRDVTANVERQASLRESELRFRLLAENSRDIICRYALDTTCVWISPSTSAITGWTPEEVIGRKPSIEHYPDGLAVMLAPFEDPHSMPDTWSGTFRYQHRDGRVIWLESTASPVRDSVTGEVIEVQTTSRDVTERVEAEENARRASELFRVTLESVADAVIVTRPGGEVLFWNSLALESLAIPAEVVDSRSSPALLAYLAESVLDSETLASSVHSVSKSGLSRVGIWRTKKGKTFEAFMHPIPDPDGGSLRVWSIRDITEKSAAEEALRGSEDRLRTVINNAPLILAQVATDGTFVLAEGEGLSALAMTAEGIVGHDYRELFSDAPEVLAVIERPLAGEEFSTTISFGSRQFAAHVSPTTNDDGLITGMIGVAFDVTDRLQAEHALRNSEARFRLLAEQASDVIVVFDPAGVCTWISPSITTLCGWQPEEFIGTLPRELVHPEDFAEVALKRQEVLATANTVTANFRFLTKAGGYLWMESKSKSIRDPETGEVIEIQLTARDVTARMEAQEEIRRGAELLRESEETARALLNAPTDGAVLVDHEGTILAYNATAEQRFHEHAALQGVDTGSFIGACVFDIFSPELRAQRKARNDEVFANGERRHFEDERDGVWTDVTLDPVRDAGGNVVRLAIFSRDITDRKQDEAALKKRSRELEALNDYLEKMSAQLERSQFESREASEQLAELLDVEQIRAKTDPLTGALNHGAISEVISETLAAEVAFALAMVDVDGMKTINDTFGHQAGDDVLLAITHAITRGGAVAGRYGGDEFLVALLSADQEEAEAYKAAVEAELREANVIDAESGARVPVIASVGIALYPDEGSTLPELVERADERMYAEKRARQGLGSGLSSSRVLGGERAARMVGELVPLLTSTESLDDKLRLVSHRLSVGAGYAGVSFDVFSEEAATAKEPAPSTANQNAFAKAPEELIEAWNEQQRSGTGDTGVNDLLRVTRKPLIIDDIEVSQYVTEDQRRLLLAVGIRAGIVIPLFDGETILATMSVGSKEIGGFGVADEQFLSAVAGQVSAIIRMARLVEHLQQATDRLEESRDETVMLLAAAAEAHSQVNGSHFENVRNVSEMIAVEMGFGDEDLRELGLAAALHDIGKIHLPDALLSSSERVSPNVGAAPGRLEWETLKEHCEHGRNFLARTKGFELAARVAYTHHERHDGAGYPEGLAGDQIPLESAIIAVADSLDSMLTERAYQPGVQLDDAAREIFACSGTQFHPEVVDAFRRIYDRGELGIWWDGLRGEHAVADAAA